MNRVVEYILGALAIVLLPLYGLWAFGGHLADLRGQRRAGGPIGVILVEDDDGKATAHHPDCPIVAAQRLQGRPMATVYGVLEGHLPDLRQHDCLLKDTQRDD